MESQIKHTNIDDLELTEEERQRLATVEHNQNELHAWLKKKRTIQDTEKNFIELKSYKDFASQWSEFAFGAQRSSEAQRQQGWRKWARRYETFAAGADQFMRDFDGMLQFAALAGSPYAGPAIGTIGLLFAISRNKYDLEDMISSTLLEIKDRLPGFEMYEKIYDYEQEEKDGLPKISDIEMKRKLVKGLKKKIVLAYISFIELTIEATKFYMKGGLRRWASATWSLEDFKRRSDEAQTAVIGVRLKCEELLAFTVHDIWSQNTILVKEVSTLKSDNETFTLISIKSLLGLSTWGLDHHKKKHEIYRKQLAQDQEEDSIFSQKFGGPKPDYRPGQEVLAWSTSGASSMLLVIGVNDELIEEGRRTCWLSAQAFELIDRPYAPPSFLAFYAFSVYKETLGSKALSILLLQLLDSKKSAIRGEYYTELCACLSRYANPKDNQLEERKSAIREAALKTVELFKPNEAVWLVIDRIDQCEESDRVDFLQILLDMMSESCCILKIFAVAKRTGWKIGEEEIKGGRRVQFTQVVLKQDLLKPR